MSIRAINTTINNPRPRSKWIHRNEMKKLKMWEKKKYSQHSQQSSHENDQSATLVNAHGKWSRWASALINASVSHWTTKNNLLLWNSMPRTEGRPMITISRSFYWPDPFFSSSISWAGFGKCYAYTHSNETFPNIDFLLVECVIISI